MMNAECPDVHSNSHGLPSKARVNFQFALLLKFSPISTEGTPLYDGPRNHPNSLVRMERVTGFDSHSSSGLNELALATMINGGSMWFLLQIGAAIAVISLLLKGLFLPGIVLMLAYVAGRFATEVVTCTIELGEGFRR
jgi:hypothetical protein